MAARCGESPGSRQADRLRGSLKPQRSPDPHAIEFLSSQAPPQRSIRPGLNPGNARIQGFHHHANALADNLNGERKSNHQQAQAHRNEARGNIESEHQDDKKRRESQHIPFPPFDMLAPNWGGTMKNVMVSAR